MSFMVFVKKTYYMVVNTQFPKSYRVKITTRIDFLVLGFGRLTCREVAHVHGAHARDKRETRAAQPLRYLTPQPVAVFLHRSCTCM